MKMEQTLASTQSDLKVAAARKMISQLTPRNEDQRRKIQAAENPPKWRGKLLSEPRLEGTTRMAWYFSD
jgi:hypothetical protein